MRRRKSFADNPVIVEEVRLEGFDVLPARAREDLADDLPLRAGVALTDELEKSAGERAVEILQNHGYPYAQVSLAREPIDAKRTRVIVRAEPGTLGFFGRIDIAGNRRVDDRHHPQAAGVRAGRSVPAQRDRADPAADRRARPVQVGRDPRAGHRPSARRRADARLRSKSRTPWQWNRRTGLCGGRAARCRRAHQPSERSRRRAAARSAGPCLAHRAHRRGGVHADRRVASRAVAVAAGAAPGDRRARRSS